MTRGRWIFAICLAGSFTVAGTLAYKRWPQFFRRLNNQKTSVTANSSSATELSAIPPFSTKEPDRYQATRIVTSVEYLDDSASAPKISRTLIARDGDSRREEYEAGNETVVLLETPAGRFVILPAKKLYSDLNADPLDSAALTERGDASADLSSDRLLNETRALARYERLGAERINGRATTKYRVTPEKTADNAANVAGGKASSEIGAGGVTLIWIDDALGLPIRSEISSTAGEHPGKQTVELRDLKETIDAGTFELPKDYRKVEHRMLFLDSANTRGASPDERGASPDENVKPAKP